MVFFIRKMILAKTWYETHNSKLLVIVKAFKTWSNYLEGFNHKVLILIDNNNLQHFMNIKNLSSKRVCWDQELSRYHFWIDCYQGKANKAANALLQYL